MLKKRLQVFINHNKTAHTHTFPFRCVSLSLYYNKVGILRMARYSQSSSSSSTEHETTTQSHSIVATSHTDTDAPGSNTFSA
jgi:hypothetical protein